ncbi:ABC transporter ATP-binding protein [Lederbergia panacisoli]|uniref:ABC transporter ATP-binding protein n=1 Tax=Lederbergia panacisoli TaxID=1255251 RepID=UPI00214C7218|nr:ABC transporter transmembrane domain-containing protein [Lederbergia panacisoli]MCR2823646.1 ABC transporter transmembrane domain-containing protein [Lederbergia panacisoli]
MKNFPEELKTLLSDKGLSKEGIINWQYCDRGIEGGFADTYLILTKESLYRLSSDDKKIKEKVFKGYEASDKKKKFSSLIEADKFKIDKFKLEEIDSAYTVNLIASGLIVIKAPEEKAIAAMTNGYMGDATKFVSTITKLKNNETIDMHEEDDAHKIACPKCGLIYPEHGRQVCPKCLKKGAIFGRLLGFTTNYKWSLFFIIFFMLLNSATGLAIPYFQGTVLFDQALGGTGQFAGKIALVILIIIVFRTLSLVFGVLFGVINARMAANIVFDLKSNIFTSMQRLSLSFFQKRQTGQLMTRVNDDANELQFFFVDGIPYFVVNAINIIGVTAILLVMDWKLTLICLIPLPFVVLLIRWVFPKLWRMSWKRHRRASAMNSIISDTVRSARIVKAFGKEKVEINRFQGANVSFSAAEQRFNKTSSTIFPIINMLTQIGGVLIWAFGGWKVMGGDMTFGEIMTFITYIYMLFGPIQFMNNIAGWWSYCMAAAQRIFEIQDAVPEITEKEDALHLEKLKGDITISNINFNYEPNKPILQDVSLVAKQGQMIGIVGPSGAGKSTLVNLISRLYDVNEGEIKIDGMNVKDLATDTLRNNIGIVSQEVYVFIGTIAENIAYANPDCSLEEIIYAAKIANAHDFIENLPEGYDTVVGTGGYNLSGGEKQRISIARAILHDPKILILDEATASLDTKTELQIQEALESLAEGRTTIAIAHRLSTLRNADYLYVMENGKVVEDGTHEELMDKDAKYAGMVKKHEEALKMKEAI